MGERANRRFGVRATLAVAAITGVALALGACGGDGDETSAGPGPFADEVIACLESRGAEARLLDEFFETEAIVGQTADGDIVFVFTTPNPRLAARAIRVMKNEKREAGPGTVMLISKVNGGSTVVGVIGHQGVNGGVPSVRSEALVRNCAVRPQI